MAENEVRRNLSSFVKDDTGFVSRDSLLKLGGVGFVFSTLLLGLSSDGEAYQSHTNLKKCENTHVNCLTHPRHGCAAVDHHNRSHHIDHTSNCY